MSGAERDRLDPILDACMATYRQELDEDGQVACKGRAKAFLRTYGFLASILPSTNADWERRSIFLTFLVPKLPAPGEEDLARGILAAIDMDSYRVEKQAAMAIILPDSDAAIGPVPAGAAGRAAEPELDHLSRILAGFNDLFGNIAWSHEDRAQRLITEEIPERVAADTAYQNARIEHEQAMHRVMISIINDVVELFRQFIDNEGFRRWLIDNSFRLTYAETT